MRRRARARESGRFSNSCLFILQITVSSRDRDDPSLSTAHAADGHRPLRCARARGPRIGVECSSCSRECVCALYLHMNYYFERMLNRILFWFMGEFVSGLLIHCGLVLNC